MLITIKIIQKRGEVKKSRRGKGLWDSASHLTPPFLKIPLALDFPLVMESEGDLTVKFCDLSHELSILIQLHVFLKISPEIPLSVALVRN